MNVSSNDTCMVLSVYTDFPIPVTGVLLSLAHVCTMYIIGECIILLANRSEPATITPASCCKGTLKHVHVTVGASHCVIVRKWTSTYTMHTQ